MNSNTININVSVLHVCNICHIVFPSMDIIYKSDVIYITNMQNGDIDIDGGHVMTCDNSSSLLDRVEHASKSDKIL